MGELDISLIVVALGLVMLVVINWLYEHSWRSMSLHQVDNLSGIGFEKYLAKMFRKQGYKARVTPPTSDFGADLIIKKSGKKIAVQAKRYRGKVSIGSIQEVVASVAYYKANESMVVTNSYYTRNAKRLAKPNNVELIDRNQLKKWVYEFNKTKKLK